MSMMRRRAIHSASTGPFTYSGHGQLGRVAALIASSSMRKPFKRMLKYMLVKHLNAMSSEKASSDLATWQPPRE